MLLIVIGAFFRQSNNADRGLIVAAATTTKTGKNRKGVETSSIAYQAFILKRLKECDGVIYADDLYREIEAAFGHTFGVEDRRLKRVGVSGKQPKWQNAVDWAKSVLTRQGLIATRKALVEEGRRTTVIVARPYRYDLFQWARRDYKRSSFTRICEACSETNNLSDDSCTKCGNRFPAPNTKVIREPRKPR